MSPLGTLGLSERLLDFVAEMPLEREPILAFVAHAAREVSAGARVLDVGAGDAPYRELFVHADYVTVDWEQSPHERARSSTIIASAERIPEPDASADAVLLTQVLEHVPDPGAVLREQRRLLRAGGRIFVSVPLVWELHEEPHDFYRYTGHALAHLLAQAGFGDVEVHPRGGSFEALAQLVRNLSWSLGSNPRDGLDDLRRDAPSLLDALAERLVALQPLDTRSLLPLGFTGQAIAPPDGR